MTHTTPASLFHYVQALEQHTRGWPQPLARRHFLKGAAALAAGNILAAAPLRQAQAQTTPATRFSAYPFALGVASGAPRPDSVVLWTKLAPEPLAQAGDGGMPPERVTLQWELADDDQFKKIVKKGSIRAVPELGHSVHPEVSGLEPGRWYFYRFMAGGEVSPTGRTRTADVKADKLRFAFASCQQWEQGYFSAYRHMLADNLDMVVFLGDYIYEAPWGSQLVRRFAGPEPETLAHYRVRHGQYKTDPDLKAMHQAVPWLLTWDDHEVDNDYADDQSEHLDPRFLLRRAAAYQAYYEHMPLPRSALPRGTDMRIYDRYSFGGLADFHILDDRQYRHHQVCPRPGMGGSAFVPGCNDRLDPKLSLLGTAQEQWLADGIAKSTATWNVLAQQTLMAPWGKPGPAGTTFWTDGWDGYPAARKRLLDMLAAKARDNTLVIGGDVHTHHVANLHTDFDNPKSRIVATEFCGTFITSESDNQPELDARRPSNPHMLLADGRKRGYITMELGRDKATSTLRLIDSEKLRDSKVSTLASFVVQAGKPGAQAA